MANNNYSSSGYASQRGAALIFSLILLLVLTLLGLSSMRTATMEEKMAGNMRDRNLAFEAAESALREGENWINRQTASATILNQDFTYAEGTLPIDSLTSANWWQNNSSAEYGSVAGGAPPLSEVGAQPQFVIEERAFLADSLVNGFSPTTGKNVFRIVARGTGGTGTAQSITESTYAKRFN